MSTKILSVKPKRNGEVEVSTSRPDLTFSIPKEALDGPHSFAQAMLKATRARPSGRVFGHGDPRFLAVTKGQRARQWQAYLGKNYG